MYLAHWGLREAPFRQAAGGRAAFQSPTQEEALARLHFLVDQRRALGLLLGSSGCGKTTVLESFAAEQRRTGAAVVCVPMLGTDAHELIWRLAAGLELNPAVDKSPFALWRELADRFVELRYEHRAAVLALDDADESDQEALLTASRLTELEPSGRWRPTIVLSAAPEHVNRLGNRLLDLAELKIDLEAWEEADTLAYLDEAVRRAGRATPIFSRQAGSRLHDMCQGVPRRVNQLADLAMLAGAGAELTEIDEETILAVYQELGVIDTSLCN